MIGRSIFARCLFSSLCLAVLMVHQVRAQTLPTPAELATRTYAGSAIDVSSSKNGYLFTSTATTLEWRNPAGAVLASHSFGSDHVAALADSLVLLMAHRVVPVNDVLKLATHREPNGPTDSIGIDLSAHPVPPGEWFTDVAAGPGSLIYLSTIEGRVYVCDVQRESLLTMFTVGASGTAYKAVLGLAAGPDSTIVVPVDNVFAGDIFTHTYKIYQHTVTGSALGSFDAAGRVKAIACDASGTSYVFYGDDAFSHLTNRVRIYSWSGSLLKTLDLPDGYAYEPAGITVDNGCALFCGASLEGTGTLVRPWSMDFDQDGLCDSWEVLGLRVSAPVLEVL